MWCINPFSSVLTCRHWARPPQPVRSACLTLTQSWGIHRESTPQTQNSSSRRQTKCTGHYHMQFKGHIWLRTCPLGHISSDIVSWLPPGLGCWRLMIENLWKTLTQRYRLEKSSHSAKGIPFLERKAMQADQYTQTERTQKEWSLIRFPNSSMLTCQSQGNLKTRTCGSF